MGDDWKMATTIEAVDAGSRPDDVAPRVARCRDYRRIEAALDWLADHAEAQPSLARAAAAAGLGEHHFQRLFSRWVGISPKRFLQYISLTHAKQSLAANASVLDAAFDAGLPGPGRLHDLFVTHEAVTPGEYKARGAGLTVRYGVHHSPFGECLVMTTPRGICGLWFIVGDGRTGALARASAGWENAEVVEDEAATAPLAARIFREPQNGNGNGTGGPPVPLLLRGTPFQIKVWEALLRIPPGALVSYQDIARCIGQPGAVRAVGLANGRNAIAYLIPCHRVIRKSGLLGGYGGGLGRKLAMIGWEAARAECHAA